MNSHAAHPELRLSGREWDDPQQARLAVIKENRIAAHSPGLDRSFATGLDTKDPRWILAMQTQSRLQGSVLVPELRDQLLRNGAKLGLRPFESNLVIAIIQDRARAGNSARSPVPLLSLVGHSIQNHSKKTITWPKWLAAFAAATAMAAVLIRWLGS